MLRIVPVLVAVLLAGLLLGGCSSGMASKNIVVELGSALRTPTGEAGPSLEVDLVGVSDAEAARWTSYPVGQYFSGNDQFRSDAPKKTLAFASGSAPRQSIASNDPIWGVWRERAADQLFILVNLPGVDDRAGGEDPRRFILPLDRARWNDDTIVVEVQRSAVVLRTPMKPAK